MGRYFPPKQTKPGSSYQPATREATIPIPPVDSTLIAAAGSNTFTQQINMPVKEFRFDVPLQVTTRLTFDGTSVHRVRDSGGNTGSIPFDGLYVNLAVLEATNNSGAAQDVRYWIVCQPG